VFSTWPSLQALANALRINQTVKIVDLSSNNFGDDGVKARPPPHLTKEMGGFTLHCILDSARDTTKSSQFFDAQALADALRANKTIRSVDLRSNNLYDTGGKGEGSAAAAPLEGDERVSHFTAYWTQRKIVSAF